MTMAELLPCPNPWCGSTEIIRISSLHQTGCADGEFRSCVRCGLNGPTGKDEAESAELWNTRPTEQSIRVDQRERDAKVIATVQPDEEAAGCPASWGDFVQVAQSAIRAGEE